VRDSPLDDCRVIEDGELLVTVPLNVVPSFKVTVAGCPLDEVVVLLQPASRVIEITSGMKIVARICPPVFLLVELIATSTRSDAANRVVRYDGSSVTSEELAFGFIQYVVFLLSTTCHEAAHALAAKWGGDTTALEGGQVSLSPLPHIRREPFGMVIMPLLCVAFGNGLIGWASAPYNPKWAMQHPKRAAWMSLAGPVANFSLALLAGIAMRIGIATGAFVPLQPSYAHIVGAASSTGVADGVAVALSVFFSLNILLGIFNLIPFPPLDGYGVLGLFMNQNGALRLQEMRMRVGMYSFLGLVIAWQLFDRVFPQVFDTATRMFYAGYPIS
jgi:Zn-dependent protease